MESILPLARRWVTPDPGKSSSESDFHSGDGPTMRSDSDRLSIYCPTESVTHFLVKLVFAAPASFLSPAAVSHAVAESV